MAVHEVLSLLAATPERIRESAADLSPAELRERLEASEWSIVEVLAHLRACADVRGGAALAILASNHPTIRANDPRTYVDGTDYPTLDFATSFAAFVRQRTELLHALSALSADGWHRSATVTGAGKPLERDVLFYAQWVGEHERPHIRQIQRTARAIRPA